MKFICEFCDKEIISDNYDIVKCNHCGHSFCYAPPKIEEEYKLDISGLPNVESELFIGTIDRVLKYQDRTSNRGLVYKNESTKNAIVESLKVNFNHKTIDFKKYIDMISEPDEKLIDIARLMFGAKTTASKKNEFAAIISPQSIEAEVVIIENIVFDKMTNNQLEAFRSFIRGLEWFDFKNKRCVNIFLIPDGELAALWCQTNLQYSRESSNDFPDEIFDEKKS